MWGCCAVGYVCVVTPSVGFWKGGPKGDLVRVRVEVSPPVDDPGLW